MQLGLFAMADPVAAAAAIGAPVSDWWLSDDIQERRAGVLRSAAIWRGYHDESGLPITADGLYAAELQRLAADMEADPEYHRRKPVTISDVRWFRLKGDAA